jgi:hypothetical protein
MNAPAPPAQLQNKPGFFESKKGAKALFLITWRWAGVSFQLPGGEP